MDAKDKGQSGTRGYNQGQWSSSTMRYQSVVEQYGWCSSKEKNCSMFNNLWTEGRQTKLKVYKTKFDKFAPTMNLE